MALVELGRGRRPVRATRSARPSAPRRGRGAALDRGHRARLRDRVEAEAEAAATAARGRSEPARRDLTGARDLHGRPGDAPATSTTPSPPSAEGDGMRLWIHIADVAAHVRPGTALDARGARARDQHLRPGHGRADAARRRSAPAPAASLPGVERLAVTAEIVLDGDGRGALGELLPQPDPLRRPPRLRPARRDLRRPRRSRRQRSPSRWRSRAGAAAALRRPAPRRRARGRLARARVRVRRRRRRRRRPRRSSRPRPTG